MNIEEAIAELDKAGIIAKPYDNADSEIKITGYPIVSPILIDKSASGKADSFTISFSDNNWIVSTYFGEGRLAIPLDELSDAIKMTCHIYNSWGTLYGEDGSMTIEEALTKLAGVGITAKFEVGYYEFTKTIHGGAGPKSIYNYGNFDNTFAKRK